MGGVDSVSVTYEATSDGSSTASVTKDEVSDGSFTASVTKDEEDNEGSSICDMVSNENDWSTSFGSSDEMFFCSKDSATLGGLVAWGGNSAVDWMFDIVICSKLSASLFLPNEIFSNVPEVESSSVTPNFGDFGSSKTTVSFGLGDKLAEK